MVYPKDILDYYTKNLSGRGRGGWPLVAEILGLGKDGAGTAYQIAHGSRKLTKRMAMRWQWWVEYQEALPDVVEVLPCPTCGRVHVVGNCHGVEGEPVIVPRGYIVKPAPQPNPKRKRKKYYRPTLPDDLRGKFTSKEIEEILRSELANRTS